MAVRKGNEDENASSLAQVVIEYATATSLNTWTMAGTNRGRDVAGSRGDTVIEEPSRACARLDQHFLSERLELRLGNSSLCCWSACFCADYS